ncbi:MAG: site-specific DNA-methyltransferase, partial [Oscillospiraceae bacterium]|nr:site-specific DNA-methyltransferase [Oscillospiraceae bacterium]
RIPSKYPGKRYFKGEKKGQVSGNPKGKNPEDVWEMTLERLYDDWESQLWDIPNVKNNHVEKVNHPCQFPVELVERCVLALTDENDIVYDPFAGVGSSLIAALKNNRQAYGTELEQSYVDIGKERIRKLEEGNLLTRPIYQKIWVPSPNDKVAQIPKEWSATK